MAVSIYLYKNKKLRKAEHFFAWGHYAVHLSCCLSFLILSAVRRRPKFELDYIEWYVLYIKFVYVYLVECPNTVMHVELLR